MCFGIDMATYTTKPEISVIRRIGKRAVATTPKRHRGYQKARFSRMELGFRRTLQEIMHDYRDGKATGDELKDGFRDELRLAQQEAYLRGKRAAGDFRKTLTPDDMKYLHGQLSMEMKYFHGFERDLKAGKWEKWLQRGGKRKMRPEIRMDLYGLSLHSVYQRGAFEVARQRWPGARFLWRMEPSEHCDTCVKNAADSDAQGGFTAAEIEKLGMPGEHTICGNRCRCNLKVIAPHAAFGEAGVRKHEHKRYQPTAFYGVVDKWGRRVWVPLPGEIEETVAA